MNRGNRWVLVLVCGALSGCGGLAATDESIHVQGRLEVTGYSGGPRYPASVDLELAHAPMDGPFVAVEANAIFDDRDIETATPGDGRVCTLGLHTRADLAPGTHTGNVRVHLYEDYDRQHEVSGSPVSVPYSIHLLRGLVPSELAVQVTAPFGTIPEPRHVSLSLPEALQNSTFDIDGGWGALEITALAGASDGSAVPLTVTPVLAPAGHYTRSYIVEVRGKNPAISPDTIPFQGTLQLTYDVTPVAGAVCAMSPANTTVHLTAGGPGQGFNLLLDLQDRSTGSFDARSVDYVSGPPTATGNALAQRWVNIDSPNLGAFWVSPCTTSPTAACLPAGTYEAVIHYPCHDASASQTLDHRVTMIVDP